MLITTNGIPENADENDSLRANREDISRFIRWFFGLPIWKELNRGPEIRLRLLPSGREYVLHPGDVAQLNELIKENEEGRENLYWVSGIAKEGLLGCAKDTGIVSRIFLLLDFDHHIPDLLSFLRVHLNGCFPSMTALTSSREGVLRHQAVFYIGGNLPDQMWIDENKRLIRAVDADPAVFNHSRLLRLPGSVNWKEGSGCGSRLLYLDANYGIRIKGSDYAELGDSAGLSIDLGADAGVGALISWKRAVEIAGSCNGSEPKEAIREGGRDNALTAWLGEMEVEGLSLKTIHRNLLLLASKMCVPPYTDRGVLERFMRTVEGWRMDRLALRAASIGELRVSDDVDTEEKKEAEDRVKIVELFRKKFAKELISSDADIVKLLKAITFYYDEEVGHEGLLLGLIDQCFTRLGCNYGQYYQGIISGTTIWGSVVFFPVQFTKDELLSVVNHALIWAADWLVMNAEKVAAIPEVAGSRGLLRVFRPHNPFIERISKCLSRNRHGEEIANKSLQKDSYVVFQNGVFDLATGEFSADSGAAWKYPNPLLVNYISDRPAPEDKWCGYLHYAFRDDVVASSEVLYRMIALISSRMMGLDKIFVFQGATGSGKSTVANFIRECMGMGNTQLTNYTILGEKHAFSSIGIKLVSFLDEAETVDKKVHADAGRKLKEITSGRNRLSVRPMHKAEREVDFYCRVVIMTNEGIEYDDPSGALQRRLVPVYFERTIQAPGNADKVKAILCAEGDKVFSEAVRRFSKAYREESISKLFDVGSKAVARAQEENAVQMNPVGAYLDSGILEITEDPVNFLSSQSLITLIRANLEGMHKGSDQVIGKQIHKHLERVYSQKAGMKKVQGNAIRGYSGLRLVNLDAITYLQTHLTGINLELFLINYPFEKLI